MLWLAFFSSLVLYFFSFPPFNLFPLAWVAPLPLFWMTRSLSVRRRFFIWWLWGFCFFSAGLYWLPGTMKAYSPVSWWQAWCALLALALYLGLFWGVWGWWSSLLKEKGLPFPLALALPLAFLEYLRGHLFTGFPWLLAAHSQASFLPFIQSAALVGVYGVSFILAWIWGGVLDCLERNWRGGALAFILPIALMIWGWVRLGVPVAGRSYKVALVQPNIGAQAKWDPDKAKEQMDLLLDLTREACPGQDLVIFPETVFPYLLFQRPHYTQPFVEEIKNCSAYVLVGTNHWVQRGKEYFFTNREYLLLKGRILGFYDKVHLVPFGEYVPLGKIFPFLYKLAGYRNGYVSGRGLFPLPLPGCPLGVSVCYEAIFPSLVREEVKKGAKLLVNVTNDAWFGRSLAPYQHLTAAVFRAVENERWLVRCANTGISALVSPKGRITAQTPLFTREILRGRVEALSGVTPYTLMGDWLPLLSGGFILIFVFWGYFKPGYFSGR